ncbi:Tectonin beta-propeller repeat-containing protein 2 [Phytophthora cactorum]|nr:Tectonin beta-propeller repeat-containing protein 2 [Phytophthora cactorum]
MPPNGGDAAVTPVRSRPLLHYKDLGLGTQNRKRVSVRDVALSRSESDRASAKYHLVKTISPPSNDRVAVTCLSICPLQKRLVVGTMRGVVYAIQLSDYHKIGEKVEFSHDFHAGFPITCFLWDRRGARLFSACNAGLVCQTMLRAGVSAIFGSTDTELLLKEETGIVQLDLAKSERSYILMVSSQLRVLLLNLTAGDGSAVQIGTKARQGSYGACFFTSLNVEAIDPAKKREIKVFSEVTLGTGSTLHKPIEYFDVLAPSDQSYSKSICAPDGSFMEARLMEIPELPRTNSVLADDYRENYMEEVMEEVKQSEQVRNEEGTMNMNLLPVLKDGSTAAAKAFSTFIPGSSMLTHLMDGSMITDPFGRSDAAGIFNDFPEFDDDELVIDPDPRLFQRRYTHEADESNLDTEVLLEAISMDIWDSNLKYTSNLPISEQLNLPESGQDSKENGSAHTERVYDQERVKENERKVQPHESKPALIESLKVQTSIPTASSSGASTPVNKLKQRLVHRASMSPDAGRAAQRGRIAVSPELEPTIRRDVSELTSELQAASATAEKTKQLTRRLWPASGITDLYLLQGDMKQVQATISAWLNCFDPTAQHEGPEGSDDSIDNKSGLNVPATTTGFARGEALVDGDGLPLTRGDWNLVRTLVSIYFAIWAAGSKLHLHPLNLKDHADDGDNGDAGTTLPWDSDGDNSETESATAEEAEAFVAKYGVYINPDLAAEVCNLRQFTGALKIVLDEVVSSADMEETCDDIVSWISEKESGKAFSTLRERDSLCLLLHLLDILLKKCPQQTIELCVSKYPVLYPWNIEQALFGIELDWEAAEEGENGAREIYKPTTLAQTSKYFRYLVRLLEEKGNEAGKDAQVVSRCLELCFADSAVVGDLFEHEERSSRIAWNNAFSALMELTILSLRDEGDVAALKRGFSELSDNELVVLDAVFERVAVLPHSSEECLSKILSQVQASISIENRNERMCSAVIHALLNSVDLGYGMRLLARYPMLFAAAPLQMYHTIVETHVLTERQKHEIVQILEIVDTNVWASYKEDVSATSSVSFAPQLAAILHLEMGALFPAMSRDQYELWETKCKKYDDETKTHRLSKVRQQELISGLSTDR